MTREDITRMAREAGVRMDYIFDSGTTRWILQPGLMRFATLVAAAERVRVMNEPINKEHWQRFEDEIRAAEREACARMAESMRPNGGRAWDDAQSACFSALTDLAESIRARGSK